jgi:hypothetical protein
MMYRRRYWVLILLAGIVFGALAWAALNPVDSDSREQVYVIPQGTWARRAAGEKIAVLPPEIRLTINVKDILVLRNQDDVPQLFGPVLIMPGQSFELPFRESGWARVQWRVAEIMKPGVSL